MPSLKKYHLFISHAWTYDRSYYKLVSMLKQAKNFKWSNYSVPKHDRLPVKTNKQLDAGLIRQIRPTHAVIIISGMYAVYRKWIQREIEIAQQMHKPIIGIKPRGSQKTPRAVQTAANEMVCWNTKSIVNAIRRLS